MLLCVLEKRCLEELRGCRPEGRVFHEATFYDFLERTGVFVYATFAIEGWWRRLDDMQKDVTRRFP